VLPFNVSVELTCRLRLGILPRPRSAHASCAGKPATTAARTRKVGGEWPDVLSTKEQNGLKKKYLRLHRMNKHP
jgi:hypothetical protein